MYTLMPDDIGYLKYRKQIHELEIGKAMYEWYEKEKALLNTVRQVVAFAYFRLFELLGHDPCLGKKIQHMQGGPRYIDLVDIMPKSQAGKKMNPEILSYVEKPIRKEIFLMVWANNAATVNLDGLGKVLTNYSKWSVSDCSELVRIWGGIVEEVGDKVNENKPESVSQDLFDLTQRLNDIRNRAKGQSKGFENLKKNQSRLKTVQGAHKKWEAPGKGVRERLYSHAREIPLWLQRYVYNGEKKGCQVRGCSLLKPVNVSLVKHIDSVYGLWEGADISGTTTDFIGCFEAAWAMVFEGVLGADNPPDVLNAALEVATWCFPYFALLAPAAMVYGYHHTLYEIAVALSLAYGVDPGDKKPAVFDYYIGWYDTLVPKISHVGEQAGGYGKLKRVGNLFGGNKAKSWDTSGAGNRFVSYAKGDEQALNKRLKEAINSVKKSEKTKNNRLIALVDSKGVVYGGYKLTESEAQTHKKLFHAVSNHKIALEKGADELSKTLLKELNPNYMKELAGRTKTDGSFYEKYR